MKQHKILKDYMEKNKLNIEQIINDYSGYVYTIIKNISNQEFSQEDIEEIISDTFLVLWNNASKMNAEDKVSAYLSGVANNLIKKKRRKTRTNLNIEDYENILKEQNQIEEIYDNQSQIELIEKVLKNMSKEDNEIFELFYYAGKKGKEIAKQLNITEFKVKTRLYRIRKKIKQSLEKEGYRYESRTTK